MKRIMKVTTRRLPLNVRTGPGMNYTVIGSLARGEEVTCTEQSNGWYKHDKGGWSSGDYLTIVRDETPDETKPVEPDKPSTDSKPSTDIDDQYLMDLTDEEILGLFDFKEVDAGAKFDELRCVYGLPFQFLDNADIRPANCSYGRQFLKNIINEGSFLYMKPGEHKFIKGIKKDDKESIMKGVTSLIDNDDHQNLSDILDGKTGRYYSFSPDYASYLDYVHAMIRLSAVYLGLGNEKGYDDSTPYKKFDWSINNGTMKSMLVGNNTSNPIYQDISHQPALCLYIDGNNTSYSDSMTNSTDSSMIEGFINKGSDIIKETRFLFGRMMAKPDETIMKTSQSNFETHVNSFLSKLKLSETAGAKVTGQFIDYGQTLVNGGNIILPDVWKDSSYSKSYNIELKLVSPYGTAESIYLHLLVPLFHIMALAYPKQLGRAGYCSPFLVRAFCKGWFNCDMGIVESINVKKGSQGGWNSDGLPTELDVSISLKDMYSVLAIGRAQDASHLKNTEFLDMVGTLSGININKPDIQRKISVTAMYLSNKLSPTQNFRSINRQISQSVMNKIYNFLK